MSKLPIYFRPTTAQQRKFLFQVWEATGSVTDACKRARVSRHTFYHWKSRFEEGGYEALEKEASRRPLNPQRTASEIEEMVVQLKRQNPSWGKQQIANQIRAIFPDAKTTPQTVRRILKDAGLWHAPKKK